MLITLPLNDDEMYDFHRKGLLQAKRYTTTLEDAEDAVQEAFIKLKQNQSKLRSHPNLLAWFCLVVKRNCFSLSKAQQRRRKANSGYELELEALRDDGFEELTERREVSNIQELPVKFSIGNKKRFIDIVSDELDSADVNDVDEPEYWEARRQAIIDMAFEQLNSDELLTFNLRHYQNLSFRRIGELTDLPVSEGTARARFHSGRKKLIRFLTENGEFDI